MRGRLCENSGGSILISEDVGGATLLLLVREWVWGGGLGTEDVLGTLGGLSGIVSACLAVLKYLSAIIIEHSQLYRML